MFIDLDEDTPQQQEYGKLIAPTQMSNEFYHKRDGISASGIKKAWKDPKLYDIREKLMRIPSPALDMGNEVHEYLLEPERYDPLKYSFTATNQKKVDVMKNNGGEMFNYILKNTMNEYSLIVKDDAGFERKIRMDAYDPERGIIYDLKTTRYNAPSKFLHDAYDLGYHIQASWYIDTMRMAGYKADYFAFLCVPSENPCEPYAVQLTERFVEDGRALYGEIVENMLAYDKTRQEVFFRTLDLPKWRLDQLYGDAK